MRERVKNEEELLDHDVVLRALFQEEISSLRVKRFAMVRQGIVLRVNRDHNATSHRQNKMFKI